MTKKHPIGLFGGTFDPIHCGHLKIAEQLLHALDLECIQFIPNKNPIYRDKPIANAKHRLAMARIATENHPKFLVNDIEICRPGPTYTIDTLKAIRQQTPEQSLCLLLGEDAFSRISQWHKWREILEMTHLIIINRPGTTQTYPPEIQALLDEHEIFDAHHLMDQVSGKILRHTIAPLNIAATDIRKKLKYAKDVSNEVPQAVLRYIAAHLLYR